MTTPQTTNNPVTPQQLAEAAEHHCLQALKNLSNNCLIWLLGHRPYIDDEQSDPLNQWEKSHSTYISEHPVSWQLQAYADLHQGKPITTDDDRHRAELQSALSNLDRLTRLNLYSKRLKDLLILVPE